MYYCKQCGKVVPDGASACTECGTQTGIGTLFCEHCGTARPAGFMFCTKCGQKYDDSANVPGVGYNVPTTMDYNTPNPVFNAQQPAAPYPTQNAQQPAAPYPTQNAQQPAAPYPTQNVQQPAYPQNMQQPYQNNGYAVPQQQYVQPKVFCRSCGKELTQGMTVCASCGTAKGEGEGFCAHCGTQAVPGATSCASCGKSLAPPFNFGKYFKGWLDNLIGLVKEKNILMMIAHIVPLAMSIVLMVLMFFPMASYSFNEAMTSVYLFPAPNMFGITVTGGIFVILSLVLTIAFFGPFVRKIFTKSKMLEAVLYSMVSICHCIVLAAFVLCFLLKSSDFSYKHSYFFGGTMSFSVIGWITMVLLALSVASGVLSFLDKMGGDKTGSAQGVTVPAAAPVAPVASAVPTAPVAPAAPVAPDASSASFVPGAPAMPDMQNVQENPVQNNNAQ